MLNFLRNTIAGLALTACVVSLTERPAVGQEDYSGVPVRFRRAAYDAPVTTDAAHESFIPAAARDSDPEANERATSGTATKSTSTAPLPLAPPSDRNARSRDRGSATGGLRAVSTTFTGLAIVLGLFLSVVWWLRRKLPAGPKQLPREVLEVLGKTTLGPRQELQLIRLGGKLVLLGASGTQTQSLAEITDSDEVERITTTCRQQPGVSVTASFREALTRLDASGARRVRSQETADA